MSHLKEYITKIENLEYLKCALNRLKISYFKSGQNLIIPLNKKHMISFCWNGNGYSLVYDPDFWTTSLTVNAFIKQITCEYSIEKIIHKMQKFGFYPKLSNKDYLSQNSQTFSAKNFILSRYSV